MNSFDEKEPVVSLIAETQGETYSLALEMGLDIKDFSHYFLTSDFCRFEMDAIYSKYQLEFAGVVMDEFLSEMESKGITINKSEENYYFSPYWVGMMYRYLFFRLKMFSSELEKNISIEELEKISVDCESMEIDESVDFIVQYFEQERNRN